MSTAPALELFQAKKSLIDKEKLIEGLLFCCALLSVVVTASIVLVISVEAISFFREVSFSQFFLDTEWTPLFYEKRFGIWPLINGTLMIAAIAMSVALPAGLLIAIYLSEFASLRTRKIVKPILEVLAGVPTVVYGYFALLFVTPFLQNILPELAGFNALSPGIVMGFMILPMVASLSEDALHAVPRSLKDGAYALGSTRLQMIGGVLLPAALGGIVSSFILAMSRAVGETMIVTVAAGQQPRLSLDPTESIATMTAYIVQVSLGDTPHGSVEYHSIFVVGGMLFVVTFLLNFLAFVVREKFIATVK